ncbi:MAG: S1C family serine protease [Actinomycetota bacterium]
MGRKPILVALAALTLAGCSAKLAPGAVGTEPAAGAEPATPASPLPPIEPSSVEQVVRRVLPAVVNVRSDIGQPGRRPEGTGFVVRSDGVVVTNYHVVERAFEIEVVTSDGQRLEARAIGADFAADLAVLRVDAQGLPTVPLGDSDQLRLGQDVVALGFALGLEGGPSVTTGIVSGLGRTIDAGGQGVEPRTYEDVIQTDAAINPGNSGGPLVDLEGRVVGINTAGVGAGAAENIGFAIAINRARPVIDHAIENPKGPAPLLGVSTQTVTPAIAAQLDLSVDEGVLVRALPAGGPAAEAGIEVGDVIVAVAGEGVTDNDSLQERLLEHEPDERVEVTVVRGTETVSVEVTLAVRPLPIET